MRFRLIYAGAMLLASLVSNAVLAIDPAKPGADRPPELADPLLDDLKNLPPAKKADSANAKPKASLQTRLQQELTGGEDIGEEDADPLIRIGRRMKLAEELIESQQTAKETQELQKLIADDLAELVKQSQQQGGGSGQPRTPQGGKSRQAGKPMGVGTGEARASQPLDSTQRLEKNAVEAGPVRDPREMLRKLWGHLPEKVREQMLNAPAEQFLPQYEKLIEAYFQRLSEERPN